MNRLPESVVTGAGLALAIFFWIWLFRRLYLNGWRPLIFVLFAIGWERLKFYVSWIRYSRRRDRIDALLDDAERLRRRPTSGLIEKPDP